MYLFLKEIAILKSLVIKNLKAKYAGSMLGTLWVFINPLLLSLVITFVFTEIIKINVKHFYLFVMSGMLPWAFFAASLQESSSSIVGNVDLLKQFSLPRLFIPTSVVLSNLIIFLSGFLIVFVIAVIVDKAIILCLPFLLITIALHLVFTLGLALFLSVVYVYFRDVGQLLNTLLLFWLWCTPVFYSAEMVPEKFRVLFSLNPLTPYMHLYRSSLYEPSMFSPHFVYLALLFCIISFVSGYLLFTGRQAYFLKHI